jgi:hypothetical protein
MVGPDDIGLRYQFTPAEGHEGYGSMVRARAGYGELSAEMRELDLQAGMSAEIVGVDEDTGWPIVGWTDTTGIDRRTTIDQETFRESFTLSD